MSMINQDQLAQLLNWFVLVTRWTVNLLFLIDHDLSPTRAKVTKIQRAMRPTVIAY